MSPLDGHIKNDTYLKGIVHPEMKVQALSPHPHADRKPGEVFTPQNTKQVQ